MTIGTKPVDAADLVIRRATPDDARAIAEISILGWQAAYRGILPDPFLDRLRAEPRERGWRAALEAENAASAPVWMAEAGGRPVGFVSSGPPRDADLAPGAIEVYAIYVLPSEWRHGTGARLLTTAVEDARIRGAGTVVLWVLEENARGRSFYDAMGWRPDGGRQLFEFADVSAPEVRYRLELTAA